MVYSAGSISSVFLSHYFDISRIMEKQMTTPTNFLFIIDPYETLNLETETSLHRIRRKIADQITNDVDVCGAFNRAVHVFFNKRE